jgi:hypothetical protein
MLPDRFDWTLFAIALLLMAAPIIQCTRQIARPPARQSAALETNLTA